MTMIDYEILSPLGEGCTRTAWLVECKDTVDNMAVLKRPKADVRAGHVVRELATKGGLVHQWLSDLGAHVATVIDMDEGTGEIVVEYVDPCGPNDVNGAEVMSLVDELTFRIEHSGMPDDLLKQAQWSVNDLYREIHGQIVPKWDNLGRREDGTLVAIDI